MRKSTKNIWMGSLLRFELNIYNRILWSVVRIKEGVLGVKVYGSWHPTSKRTWDTGGQKSEKGEKQVECSSLGGREMEEVRHLEPGSIRD